MGGASERARPEEKRMVCRLIVEGLRREGAGVRKCGAVCFDFGCVTSPAEAAEAAKGMLRAEKSLTKSGVVNPRGVFPAKFQA